MTPYEIVAICLSVIAILIPLAQWIWKKFIVKAKLNFYPNGKVLLFFNQSGSYVRLDGVFEALKASISIKKLTMKIIRRKDSQELNLAWSVFISPVNQNLMGAYLQNNETAHPFRIEADSIMCAFTEFANIYDSNKSFTEKTKNVFALIPTLKQSNKLYDSAYEKYILSEEYKLARMEISKDFFWEIGKYDIIISAEHGNTTTQFKYCFTVNEHDYSKLTTNICESIITPLKNVYAVPLNYQSVFTELSKTE